jgi:hypothetical protein
VNHLLWLCWYALILRLRVVSVLAWAGNGEQYVAKLTVVYFYAITIYCFILAQICKSP